MVATIPDMIEKTCKTMVCVTAQRNCERLIRAGSRMAEGIPDGLSVIHVAALDTPFLDGTDGNEDAQSLGSLYRIVREYDADMTVVRDTKPIDVLVAHARKIDARCVIIGTSGTAAEPFANELGKRLPGVEIRIIP